ncbi:alpha/beta hydrolase [Hungatella hathewayi]
MLKANVSKNLTTKNLKGCKTQIALTIVIILISSFFANLVSTEFGRIKNETITIDMRGASLGGIMYYPAGTSSSDKLPTVVIVHGANSNKLAVRNWAEEIARRGYVAVDMDAYGNGLSEQPPADENGGGIENYSNLKTPAGIIDMLNYLRSVSFVDSTRLALVGHSLGSRRVDAATVMDCGYFSLNDILINILYDQFGISFTEDEIYLNADKVADEKLDESSLAYYKKLRQEAIDHYYTRVKTSVMVGGKAIQTTPKGFVNVAGFEVQRSVQANIALINGKYDTTYNTYNSYPETREAWYTGEKDVISDTWYIFDDQAKKSITQGMLYDEPLTSNVKLEEAINEKSVWIYSMAGEETHAGNLISGTTCSSILQVLQQTLNYNNGELTDPDTKPINVKNLIFWYREILNFIALLAMFYLPVCLGAYFLHTEYFVNCISALPTISKENTGSDFSKKRYYIISIICATLSFFGVMYVNVNGEAIIKPSGFFPLARGQGNTFTWILICDAIAIFSLIITAYFNKRETGKTNLKNLYCIKFVNACKCILLGLVLLAFNYFMASLIKYLFNQYFVFWVYPFADMKIEYWLIFLRYFIVFFPLMFILGMNVNISIRSDISEAKDTAITVFVNSIGIWACCLVNYISFMYFFNGKLFSSFQNSYPMIFLVPLMTYIHRKLYKITGNVWLGTTVITALMVWQMVSTFGTEHYYVGQNILSIVMGF